METVQPLRTKRQWWIIDNAYGRRIVDYRPNTSAGLIGPFSTELTARLKLGELAQADRWRKLNGVYLSLVGIAGGVLFAYAIAWLVAV